MSSTKQYEQIIEETIDNVRADRAKAEILITKILVAIGDKSESHREIGLLAAKYLESLTRSNETMVKVANLLKVKEDLVAALSEEERERLYDVINKDGDK